MPHGGIFFFFACINIISTGLVLLLPETKGQSLESMDIVFGSVTREEREADIARHAAELTAVEKGHDIEATHHEVAEK